MRRSLRAVAAGVSALAAVQLAAVGPACLPLGPGAVRAQEADAVTPGPRRSRALDTMPGGGTPLPPVDSYGAGSGPRGQALDDLTARIASRLRCPVCRSQSVLESSATLSQQMQREIRRRLAAGQSPEEVEDYFVSRYGEWILLKPEPKGINLLVYLLPAAALLAGGLLVWGRLREWTGTATGDGGGRRRGAGADRTDEATGRSPDTSRVGLSSVEEERLDALIRERETGG